MEFNSKEDKEKFIIKLYVERARLNLLDAPEQQIKDLNDLINQLGGGIEKNSSKKINKSSRKKSKRSSRKKSKKSSRKKSKKV